MIRVLDRRNFNFTLIENELIDDIEKFNKNDLLCYMVLCRYANNSTGECYPSYKTIAEKMRVGVSTAIKAIKSLESKGVIEISSRKNETGGDTSNLYTIKDIKQYYENKKAPTAPPVEADNDNFNNNFDTNSIPQNNKKDTKKEKENMETIPKNEVVKIIEKSCVNIKKEDLKYCEEEFTDIDKLKEALTICEINNSHGIKALRMAYKYGDRSNSSSNKGASSGVNDNFKKYGEKELEDMLFKSQEGKFKANYPYKEETQYTKDGQRIDIG